MNLRNKADGTFWLATILFVVIILAETLIKEFNSTTLFVALIGWIPLLAITIMNKQLMQMNEQMNAINELSELSELYQNIVSLDKKDKDGAATEKAIAKEATETEESEFTLPKLRESKR